MHVLSYRHNLTYCNKTVGFERLSSEIRKSEKIQAKNLIAVKKSTSYLYFNNKTEIMDSFHKQRNIYQNNGKINNIVKLYKR